MIWLTAFEAYVPFFQTLLWILLIGTCLWIFRKQCHAIIDAVRVRIERGSSLKAGPVELGEDLRQLQYIKPGTATGNTPTVSEPPSPLPASKDWAESRDRIYKDTRGVFLAHVLEPSSEPGQLYDIFIYLIRHKSASFDDVSFAEFFFGHYWGNRVFREEPQAGLVGVATSAYGPFLCACRVTFKDGYSVDLSRYIDFEMGRFFRPASDSLMQWPDERRH